MLALALCISAVSAAPVPKDADGPFEKAVIAPRDGAIGYLKKCQKDDGTWEGTVINVLLEMEGGQTALVALSLLEAGVPANDPAISKAVDYLVKLSPKKTYVVSLQTQVLARVDAKKHQEQIQKNVDWLVENAIKINDKIEGWSYPANSFPDGSNTHLGVIGLHIAAQAGAKVEEKIWKQIEEVYVRTRLDEGWSYYSTGAVVQNPATKSMTVCGLSGLTITSKHLKNSKAIEAAFDKGIKSLGTWDLQDSRSNGYAMLIVAELGKLQGSKTLKIGDKSWDWYRVGAEKLFKMKKDNGSLVDSEGRIVDSFPILSTAFGLYFLGPPKK